MKASPTRRLAVIVLLTAALTIAICRVWLYVRVRQEMVEPTRETTPAEAVHLLPGFHLRLLHTTTKKEGSWIAMTRDPQHRLIVSSENGKLFRVTLSVGKVVAIEPIKQPIEGSMGLQFAGDSFYLIGKGPLGWGLYRERMDGESFGPPEMFCLLPYTTIEHGPHDVILGPDQNLYVVCGDFTLPPANLATDSPLRNYADDQLLARDQDPHGTYDLLKPPAGFVIRVDLDGKHVQLFAGGMRNIYAIAFNSDGELFGVDNDPQMDLGSTWYRPNRLTHIISGGNYGYRQGTGKLPEYDEDSLPPTLNIGLGGPSGLAFPPAQCRLPDSYRDACFAQDWTFGRLMAIHLHPHGATYDARLETVLRGAPLNMTAMDFSPDGNLYFITGGRQTVSGLYCLSYDGQPEHAQAATNGITRPGDAVTVRELRRQYESFQGFQDRRAVDVVWPGLNKPDRWLRYAARAALEFQDVVIWKDRALGETNVEGGLTALLALARCGGADVQPDLIRALDKFPFSNLKPSQVLLKLRVMELSFIRQGPPSSDLASRLVGMLDPLYPSTNDDINHELCQLLLYLRAPDAVAKSVELLDKTATQEEQTYYIMRLRNIASGWTPELRKDYLSWFQRKRDRIQHRPDIVQYFRDVELPYSDGESFDMYLKNFLDEAVATLNSEERKTFAIYLPEPPQSSPATRGRKFVKKWKIKDLEPDLGMLGWHRSRARGRSIFSEASCVLCHRFANRGGSVGPDLTSVGRRMNPRDILESILEPSKVVPDQYKNVVLTLKNGDVLTGRIAEDYETRIVFMSDLIQRNTLEIQKNDVESRRLSNISPMPEGLVNSLSEDEIWDLIFFLKTGGEYPSNR